MKPRVRRIDLILVSVLLLVTFALYLQTRNFNFLAFDDSMYVSGNWHIRSGWSWENLRWVLTDTSSGNWHPFTYLTYLFLGGTFGVKPGIFHVTNALFHAINVGLLYLFLRRTTSRIWLSALVAALWGWHPQRVESVAWIAELKDVLCGFFWLNCMIAYGWYSHRRTAGRYVAVMSLLILALLSKPMAVMLPAVLLLLDCWPLRVHWNRWRIIEKIPMAMASLGICVVAIYTQNNRGAAGTLEMFPLLIRLKNTAVSYCVYIGKTLLPRHLSIFYPHPMVIGLTIPTWQWLGGGILLLVITGVVIWKARRAPYLFVGWFWFLLTLLPVIGLVQVGDQAMADRYTYLPSIGLIVAVVWWLGDLTGGRQLLRWFAGAAALVVTIVMIVATEVEVQYWRDTQTIFAHANAVTDRNFLARATVAYSLIKTPSRQTEALGLAKSAVQITPDRPYPREILANILQEQGHYTEAMNQYEAAIRLDPFNAHAHGEFGGLLAKMGRDDQAIKELKAAIHLDPTNADARHNLAILLAGRNRMSEAITQWRQAVRYNPGDGEIHGWLGEALRVTGDREGAIEQYRAAWKAGERSPTWAANLVWLVATDPGSSASDLDQAVTIGAEITASNKQAGALDGYAAALARTGRFDDAANAAKSAMALAKQEEDSKLASEIQMRLAGYRQGRAYVIQQSSRSSR